MQQTSQRPFDLIVRGGIVADGSGAPTYQADIAVRDGRIVAVGHVSQDIASMRELTKAAMLAGATGFSTSRSINHRTVKGDPTPSLRAAEAELTGIALGMRDAGHGVISLLSDFDTPDLDTEFAMLRRVVQASGRPLSYSLLQKHRRGFQNDWRRLLALTAAAVAEGLPIRAQAAPRPVGTLLGLQGSLIPFSGCASYIEIAKHSFDERLRALRDPMFRRRLLEEASQPPTRGFSRQLTTYNNLFPLGNPPNYEPAPQQSVDALARGRGIEPAELAYELILANDGTDFLYSPFANYADVNLGACAEMLADPNTVVGLGDGGAHVGLICDSSFPTYLLTHWGRDRGHGQFDLSWLVRRQTRDTAHAVGLLDRGQLAVGLKADLNVIDMDRLGLQAPQIRHDLPTGGKRLLQRADGYVATVVSGVVTYRDGEPTRRLPGRLVRGPQSAPA